MLVKGFTGEPAKLWAIKDRGSSVLVYGVDKQKLIGDPKPFVYKFDGTE